MEQHPSPKKNNTSARKRKQWILICLLAVACLITVITVLNHQSNERARIREQAIRKAAFKEYLQNKYAGTYYDGEFIICDDDVRVGTFRYNSEAKAYRADMPDLVFTLWTTAWDGKLEYSDGFFRRIIYREGNKSAGDTIKAIFGNEVLYSATISGYDDQRELELVKRNGYEDLVSHYVEDDTFPSIDVVVFSKTFNKDQACADVLALYNAMVKDKREDKFWIDVIYYSPNAIDKFIHYNGRKPEIGDVIDDEDNYLVRFHLLYEENEDYDTSKRSIDIPIYIRDNMRFYY